MANLIRITAIAKKLGGIHVSTAWRKIGSDPNAPKPIRLGSRHTVFDEAEADLWIEGLVRTARNKPAKPFLPPSESIREGAATRRAKREPMTAAA